jgi:hypothetical protein
MIGAFAMMAALLWLVGVCAAAHGARGDGHG